MSLVIDGQVVALDPGDPDRTGRRRVLVGDDGLVDSLTSTTASLPASFAGAPALDVGDAWVFPGVIDLHNHIGYNTLPLWTEPSQLTAFLHHNDWTNEPTYQPDVSWPAWTLARCEPDALLAYVEIKAIVGGTTAIQGSPASNKPRDAYLVRNVDEESFGTTDRDLIYTSTLTLDATALRKRAETLKTRGFIYHCAEGAPGSVVAKEYTAVTETQCLQERMVGVHCTAVTDFSAWAAKPGAVVWSPFSNLWLYGVTTQVPAARAAGLKVCLGSDWAPSGTKHVLGELKVASIWNEHEGWGLSDRELVEMVTANPGDVLGRCWPHRAGRLVAGALGDVTIVSRRSADPWRDLITTRERDVVLVVIGGQARYGLTALMSAAGTRPVGAITVAGQSRRISIPDPDDLGRQFSIRTVRSRLNAVRKDPAAALAKAERALAAAAAGGPQPLVLTLDMPFGGGPNAGPPDDPSTLVIPPLDGIRHDTRWLASIRNRGFHAGVLDGLTDFYR